VTEFLFAEARPGAPVFVRVLADGEVVEILNETAPGNLRTVGESPCFFTG